MSFEKSWEMTTNICMTWLFLAKPLDKDQTTHIHVTYSPVLFLVNLAVNTCVVIQLHCRYLLTPVHTMRFVSYDSFALLC